MTTKARDSFPDVLRGFALFGIVLVNVPLLSIDAVNGASGADLSTTSGAVTAFLVMALAQAKFYLLFSFLFGYSAHYVIKGERANRGRFIARAIGLVILGLIHANFFFHGDILFFYGLLGLLLMALYFRKEGTLKFWAWFIYVLSGVIFSALASLVFVGERYGGIGFGEITGTSGLDEALASGGFLEAATARFEVWLSLGSTAFLLQGPLVFVAFLVGVMAARKNLFADGVVSRHQMKRLAIWGITLGLPLQLWAAQIYISNELGTDYSYGVLLGSFALNFFSAPLLSAGYVGLLWLVVDKLKSAKLLANAGRASLTVYLGQSLVLSFIFSAWGLGQFGKLGLMEVTLIAMATWLVLALLMSAWFIRFNIGPMEKLLTGFSKVFSRKKS
jgi:uncharacterized protein